ncbi:RWD domain-containing protein 4-like [Hydractinia symbiolongicarpus]|uniref:RWD domain-containing protein 4-like n=1 Tax=Hydractinia symbiolongicarpus TaxID=13093 RepID=UPI00254B2BEE|nr:RWD domain-containing protein 4-like [Hydractinia symbiolongicarpus]
MEDCAEQQAEEREVLQSIYEGDEHFKEISATCFQYKYGEEDSKSVLVEISWTETYPTTTPNVNLDLFHNGYLPTDFKIEIKEKLLEQANELLDCAMTFSLFDWMKENADEYLNRIPEIVAKRETSGRTVEAEENNLVKVKKEKKEQLTKAQKRRITEQTNYKGEHERGWNWVDVVRHLSQTGGGN